MELGFSEEQNLLGSMVQALCEDLFPLAALRAVEGSEPGYSKALWAALGEQGLNGAGISEENGGLGLGALELAVIYEKFGRALAISPHFVSCVLGAGLISAAGSPAQQQAWLPRLVSGEAYITVAAIEPGYDFLPEGVRLNAVLEGDMISLSGEKHFVLFGQSAQAMIVFARSVHEGIVALLVDPQAPGITFRRQHTLASEPYDHVTFQGVQVPAENILNSGKNIWPLWREVMLAAMIPLAAEAVGAATRIFELTVEYAKQREAFGRPIGGFQAIAHYLADATVSIEGCRTLAYQAAWARDTEKPYQALAAMAHLQAAEMFRKVSALAIQVHGGIGYTTDADPQLFYRRAKAWQLMNWGESLLEGEIADALLGVPHV